MASDRIYIRDLSLSCNVGIYPEERRAKQDVILNIIFHVDLRNAGRSDRLEDTVDYQALEKTIVLFVEGSSCYLIEHLAQRVADLCLEEPRIQCVEVTVDKPGALRYARSVAVHMIRNRDGGQPNPFGANLPK